MSSRHEKQLQEADRKVRRAEKTLLLAQHARDRSYARYARARPITEEEHALLVERVATGGTLCCKDGLGWLVRRFPIPWARALNHWAYEALSCRGRDEHRPEWAEKVRKLRRDRFPGVELS